MRKYIIGGLVGILLGLSATTYADDIESLIGQKIQGQTPVYLNGTKLDDAVIINSESYAPVRKISEAAGLEVSFAGGEIQLSETQSTETPVVDPANSTEPTGNTGQEPARTVEQIQADIDAKNDDLYIMKKILAGIEQKKIDETTPGKYDSSYQTHAASVASLESEIADLEAQKAALEAQ